MSSVFFSGGVDGGNQEATLYVGNLDEKVNEALLWEIFAQAAPVVSVKLPKDRVSRIHQSFGFVEFQSEDDADYAARIMNTVKLYGKPIKVNKSSADKRTLDIGANLFVGNLDSEVDEKILYDTFCAFGNVISAKIVRDPESNLNKGFGFVNYDQFEASDLALATMNHQFLCNKPISVGYAFKRDGTDGERHGSSAERLLASQAKKNAVPPPSGPRFVPTEPMPQIK